MELKMNFCITETREFRIDKFWSASITLLQSEQIINVSDIQKARFYKLPDTMHAWKYVWVKRKIGTVENYSQCPPSSFFLEPSAYTETDLAWWSKWNKKLILNKARWLLDSIMAKNNRHTSDGGYNHNSQ